MAPGLIFLALHFSVANHILQRKVFSHTLFSLDRPQLADLTPHPACLFH